MGGIDQRPQLGGWVVLQPHLQGADGAAQIGDQLVVDPLLGVDAAGGGAILPGVVEAEGADAGHHLLEVGIIQHDHRCLAAQLHVGALHGLGGNLDQLLAGGNGAGEGDHAHARVTDQRHANLTAATVDDVDHSRWQQLGQQFPQRQGGERGHLRGFEHHCIARCQRRSQLPGRHHQRVVPGRYAGDDAQRVAADHRGEAGQILAGGRAAEAATGSGEETEGIGNGRDLVIQGGVIGLATVEGLQAGEELALGLDGLGNRQQAGGALPRWRGGPTQEGGIGGGHGRQHLLGAGFGDGD